MRPWMLIETTCVTEFEYYFGGERITFSVGAVEISTPQKKTKYVTCIVHFIILPARSCAAEFYEICHSRSTHRRNHVCQICSQSVQALQSSDTPKLRFPIDLLRRPYNSRVTL